VLLCLVFLGALAFLSWKILDILHYVRRIERQAAYNSVPDTPGDDDEVGETPATAATIRPGRRRGGRQSRYDEK